MLNKKLERLQQKLTEIKKLIKDEGESRYGTVLNNETWAHDLMVEQIERFSSQIEDFENNTNKCPQCGADWKNNRCTGVCNER